LFGRNTFAPRVEDDVNWFGVVPFFEGWLLIVLVDRIYFDIPLSNTATRRHRNTQV